MHENNNDNVLSNLLRLLETKEKPNIDLALHMISSGIVEWSEDIELAISTATYMHLLQIKPMWRKGNSDFIFSLKDDIDFFGLSVCLIDQTPTLQYSFLDKYFWDNKYNPYKPIGISIMIGTSESELQTFNTYQNEHWKTIERPMIEEVKFEYKLPIDL